MTMIKVNIAEAKASFSRIVNAAIQGERVVLCRHNVEIAEIRPLPQQPRKLRPVGIDEGMEIPDSFFEPLPEDLLRAFEGEDESGEAPR